MSGKTRDVVGDGLKLLQLELHDEVVRQVLAGLGVEVEVECSRKTDLGRKLAADVLVRVLVVSGYVNIRNKVIN